MKITKEYGHCGFTLDVTSLSAKEIEYHGVYFKQIGIKKSLYEKIINFYKDRDFFWKFDTVHDEYETYYTSTYYGLMFSISKVGRIGFMGDHSTSPFTYYYLTQYSAGNAPEHLKLNSEFITPQHNSKIATLCQLDDSYFSVYKLIAGIFKKYPELIKDAVVWEKYAYYAFSTSKPWVLPDEIKRFIKEDKGIVIEPDQEQNVDANLYDLFSDGSGDDAYVGDGLWISSGGNMHDS